MVRHVIPCRGRRSI